MKHTFQISKQFVNDINDSNLNYNFFRKLFLLHNYDFLFIIVRRAQI